LEKWVNKDSKQGKQGKYSEGEVRRERLSNEKLNGCVILPEKSDPHLKTGDNRDFHGLPQRKHNQNRNQVWRKFQR
jgi:hypothetical protein